MENLVWEGDTLYQYADNGNYYTRVVCYVHFTKAGFYRISFTTPIDGQQLFFPYPTLEEAKAAALAIYKLS